MGIIELFMAYTNPTSTDFKNYFNRDFPYGNTDLSTIQDADIEKALTQQQNYINPVLFPTQALYTQGSLLLSANFLVVNLRASSQGLAGKWDWLTVSKGAAAVQASYKIPDRIANDPQLAMLCNTVYGAQFVLMILPFLLGAMFSVAGGTVVPGGNFGLYAGGPFGPWGGYTGGSGNGA